MLILAVAAGLFAFPAQAAVPVYIVGFDANTNFEKSLFDVMINLAQRQEDFIAAFELQKIEKAREDVNKLTQETLQELENYGQAFNVPDFGLKFNVTDPASPQLSALKGSRIIANPLQYLGVEPQIAGRVVRNCYFQFLILDQWGMLVSERATRKATYASASNTDATTNPDAEDGVYNLDIDDGASGTDPDATLNSVENLVRAMVSLDLTQPFSGYDPRFELVATDKYFFRNPAVLYAKLKDFIGQTVARERIKQYCEAIYTNFELIPPTLAAFYVSQSVPSDSEKARPEDQPLFTEDEKKPMLAALLGLPTLQKSVNRLYPKELEIEEAKKPINTIDGATNAAAGIGNAIASVVGALNKLNYEIGQGIRPENLYYDLNPSASSGGSIYPFNTNRVISPAVVLLQKMQAATQAQFDLAQQGFLNLSPELQKGTAADRALLEKYNLTTRNPKSDVLPPGLLEPWLMPAADFRASPDGRLIDDQAKEGSGLPAPWEDTGKYLELGKNYRVNDYRVTANQGDNIGSKFLGVDYAINDWYDRVLEMYEPSDKWIDKNGNNVIDSGEVELGTKGNQFSIKDWGCYVATWFKGVDRTSRSSDTLDFATRCSHRITDKSY